ncbi:amino acid adenylation domain-containing protein, partial [Kitasatospora sp. NPDC057512]|uniref:amino acid adenylation domain-containing protein n=1 Tax=Kitasatospora sp. NPDC057512 TaxID=3346154 RepID=UPI0036D15E0B
MADRPAQPVRPSAPPQAPAGGTTAPSAAPRTLDALFAAQAARTPHAPALTDGRRGWSYRALAERVERLARDLRRRGAGPERTVALVLPRSMELVAAELAVARAGAAFLPVDPAYPAERRALMLADAAPALVLDDPDAVRDLLETDRPEDRDHTDLPAAAGTDHPAYVIYTSGSTGTPKGVVVTHRGIAGFTAAAVENYAVGPGDRVLQFSSPSFDASVLELFVSVLTGATLVVPPDGPWLGEELAAVLDGQRITHTLIPPAALATVPAGAGRHLRTLIVGAEACSAELVDRWAPGRRMVNSYGPTEATIVATWTGPLTAGTGAPTIGGALPHARVHVLDEAMRPRPAGTDGELYLGGEGVARGYLGRPGLTAARFVPDPFGPPGARLYRTGDRARFTADGELEFLGRLDRQVKVRGFRIEPGEIEAALRAHPAVDQAVVVVREDEPGHTRLVGYATPADPELPPDPAALRTALAAALPAHLVPAAVVVLPAFPLTPQLKIDQRALPAPARQGAAGRLAPRTERERALAAVWAEVLGLDAVGAEDDFFDLGGDSILAARTLARIAERLGVRLTLRDVFTARTVAALAPLLDRPAAEALTGPVPPAPRGEPLPLSSAQRRLWFLEDLAPGGTGNHTGVALRLHGDLDREALGRALRRLTARHDALRTTVTAVDGRLAQHVAERAELPLRTEDLATLPAGERAEAAERLLAEELERPYDLARGPLSRALLVRLAADEHLLLLAQHHIVTDGWSVGVLTRELAALLRAEATGEPDGLPAPALQYPDYAHWEQHRRADHAPQLAYWKRTLAGLPTLRLPTDRPRPAERAGHGAAHRHHLPAELVDRLRHLAAGRGTTVFTLFAGASALLLSRHCGQRDVAFGTVVNGRERRELEEVAGFFVNTVVLRGDVDEEATVDRFVESMRTTLLDAFAHAEVPFDRVVEELAPPRDPSRTPLVQVVVVQQTPAAPAPVGGLRFADHPLPRPAARFDLVLEFTPDEADGGCTLTVEYDTALFDRRTVTALAEHLHRLLAGMADGPRRTLAELPMIPEEEQRALLDSRKPPRELPGADPAWPSGWSRAYVLDRARRSQPVGVPGELYLAGDLPEQPGERLVPDPYGAPGETMYGTGELVRWTADGGLEHLGRVEERAEPRGPETAPAPAAAAPRHVAPRTPAERALAGIWAEVLRLERVGADDNFFDLGGDSILGIQVVARSRQAGLAVTSRDLYRHQTVAALALAAEDAEAPAAPAPVAATGEAVLTPIQRWWFERAAGRAGHFAQAVSLLLPGDLDRAALEEALNDLVAHHDALRSAFATPDGAGAVRWRIQEPTARTVLARHTGPDQDTPHFGPYDLADGGPLLRAVLHERAGGRPPVLHLAVHHLVVDGVSWRVLLEDLDTAYRARREGRDGAAALPAKSSPLRQWAERLSAFAAEGGFEDESAYWARAVPGQPTEGQPAAEPFPAELDGPDSYATERSVTVRLSPADTAALLRTLPDTYRTQPNDVLLSALGRALCGASGLERVVVDVEGHGREELFADLDLGRTVGWFTTRHPVALAVPAGAGWDTVLKQVKEQLRAVPRRGLGFEALRHLGRPGTAPEASAARISFNYLGRIALPDSPDGLFRGTFRPLELDADPAVGRPHPLEVVGRLDGDALEFTWFHSAAVHGSATVEALARRFAEELADLARHAAGPGAAGRTPSDFPLARLDQAAVDRITGADPGAVEDVLPLTPTQSGMLFHGLAEEDSGAYFQQLDFVLDGVPDPARLAGAWQWVTDRTAVLRAHVRWQEVPEPLLVVHRRVAVPVTHLDWRALPEEERRTRLAELLDRDRASGLDLARAPLQRLLLIRLSESRVRVLWSFHHLVLDGWSLFQVLSDVFAAHAALASGPEVPYGTVPERRPYRDYLAWLAGRDHAEAERHWRTRLAGLVEPTPLPYDREPVQSHRAESTRAVPFTLPAAATRALEDLARGSGLTLNTLVQGAWAVLLGRQAGRAEVVYGTTSSGRPPELPGVESMTGLFITTLPTRTTVPADGTLLDWLQALQREQSEDRRHGFVPLTRMRAGTGLPERTGLFDSLVVFENYPVDEDAADAHGLRLRDLDGIETTNYPLALLAYPGPELSLRLCYDPRLFDESTVRTLADRLTAALTGLPAGAHLPPARLPLLTAEERHRVLVDWNATAAEQPAADIAELFAEQVLRTPGAVALEAGDERLTYRELDARAAELAGRLAAHGVRVEQPVGVLMERSVELVAAQLALVRTGGVFVPLDGRAPRERLHRMLAEAGAELLLTDARWADTAAELRPAERVLRVDRPDRTGAPTAPPAAVHPDNVQYLMFTSGSTGTPKGVAVRRRDVAALALDRAFTGHDRVLVHSPHAFDAATYELWVPLLRGGTAVLAPPEDLDAAAVRHAVTERGVTCLWLTAGLFRLLAQEDPGCLRGAREVWTGGEAVPGAAVRKVLAACPGLTVVDGYGPTETTTFATRRAFRHGDELPATLPIGRPLDNTRVYVLDGALQPQPPGVTGELYISGAGLARGYAGRPGETAARYLADPFGPPGARMYRTGDTVRWSADGELHFVGRADDQIKIRGFRIEPAEIEARLTAHPAVAEAVVSLHQDAGRKRLAAHLVPAEGAEPPGAAELRAHLAADLPDYMLPAAFVTLPELPLTANGKVDRRRLPAPDWSAGGDRPHRAPGTDRERLLAAIWAELLGVERVGLDDDFFLLGGDSILSIQVVSRARAAGSAVTVAGPEPVAGEVGLTPIQL